MSEGLPYADIVILALVAGFILLRLRSVLGDKVGHDNPGFFQQPALPDADAQEPIVQLDEKSQKPKSRDEDPYLVSVGAGAVKETLQDIKAKDPQFTATYFLEGARSAFEMAFDAFAKGDLQTLKMLMSDPIYAEFSKEIAAREAGEHKTEHTLVSVQAKNITEAVLTGTIARLTVHFSSEQVTVVRARDGSIVEGNASDIARVDDYWAFERDTASRNPNWKIIET